MDCLLADVAVEFDRVLQDSVQTDYLMDNLINVLYFDAKKCRKPGGADTLSKKRNLQLTIDGVHLNSAGAKLYKQTIEKKITK